MKKINLKKLREVGEKATKGDWRIRQKGKHNDLECVFDGSKAPLIIGSIKSADNGHFIRLSKNNWEEMIEALKEAKEIIEVLHDDLDYKKQPSEWLDRFEDE